jgi:hypothetical protein
MLSFFFFPDRPGLWGGPSATLSGQRSRDQQVVQPVIVGAVLVQPMGRQRVAKPRGLGRDIRPWSTSVSDRKYQRWIMASSFPRASVPLLIPFKALGPSPQSGTVSPRCPLSGSSGHGTFPRKSLRDQARRRGLHGARSAVSGACGQLREDTPRFRGAGAAALSSPDR